MYLHYQGLFRLPNVVNKPSSFAYGGDIIAMRPTKSGKGTLLVTGHDNDQLVAAVTIPTPTITGIMTKANVAKLYSGFHDITRGRRAQYTDAKLGGMLVKGGKLFWTLAKYYNVDGEKIPPLWSSSPNLTNLAPPTKLPDAGDGIHPHMLSQYIIDVPKERQSEYGTFIVGRTNRPGYGNRQLASEGPAIFSYYQPSNIYHPGLFYSVDDPMIYNVKHTWKGANSIMGGFFANNATCFIARVGLLDQDYYGEASGVPGIHKPCSDDKGYHAPPYRIVCFVYNTALPSEKPDMELDLTSVFKTRCRELGGVAFDRATSTLYIVEKFVDATHSLFDLLPVVHCFKVG